MKFGSLFAGIGGFDLGFERAGLECAWQVEINEFCRNVLKKHWPNVRQWDDVRTFPPGEENDWRVDCVCGGFPCQDISSSGKRAGLSGDRSGLWFEFSRIICHLRPRFVVVENVADITCRGLDTVLGSLAEGGYDAEWETVPAAAFGIPQRRWRTFIVANAHGWGCEGSTQRNSQGPFFIGWPYHDGLAVAERLTRDVAPRVCRVANGVPGRVDRTRALGNAVVPQATEWIGRRLLQLTE